MDKKNENDYNHSARKGHQKRAPQPPFPQLGNAAGMLAITR